MKLQMIGCGGERTCDWRSYALLRDNVLHYVESGVRSGRFRALHALARAVDSGACTVDAVRLRHETLQALTALQSVRLSDAAISNRTRAITAGDDTPPNEPSIEATVKPSSWPARRSDDLQAPLPHAARSFAGAVLTLTSAAVAGDRVEIRRVRKQG